MSGRISLTGVTGDSSAFTASDVWTLPSWEAVVRLTISSLTIPHVPVHRDGVALWFTHDPIAPGSAYGAADGAHGLSVALDLSTQPTFIITLSEAGPGRSVHCPGPQRRIGDGDGLLLTLTVRISARRRVEVLFSVDGGAPAPCASIDGQLPPSGFFGFSAQTFGIDDVISIRALDVRARAPSAAVGPGVTASAESAAAASPAASAVGLEGLERRLDSLAELMRSGGGGGGGGGGDDSESIKRTLTALANTVATLEHTLADKVPAASAHAAHAQDQADVRRLVESLARRVDDLAAQVRAAAGASGPSWLLCAVFFTLQLAVIWLAGRIRGLGATKRNMFD